MRKISFILLIFLITLSAFGKNLYYGKVVNINKNLEGEISSLEMYSDYKKEHIFNISKETYWIDSGNRKALSSKALNGKDGIYVFYGDITTASLPPQSSAIAIVKNIPQDAMSAQYYVVEDVIEDNEEIKLQVDNGGLFIRVDEKTILSPYRTKNLVKLKDIVKGSRIMAWYHPYATVYPATTYASHIMLLPIIK